MKIFNFLKRSIQETRAEATSWLFNNYSQSKSGVAVTEQSAIGLSAAYAAVKVLTESVGQLPLILYKRTDVNGQEGKERASDKLLYKLLRTKPNIFMTSISWKETTMFSLCFRGNAYSQIIRNSATGEVVELLPLHPDRVTLKLTYNEASSLTGYFYEYQPAKGGKLIFRPEQILHIKGNSRDGFIGSSPLEEARDVFGLTIATDDHTSNLLASNATPTGVLKIQRTLDKDAKERYKNTWQDTYGGTGKRKGIAVLEKDMEFTPISFSPADTELFEQRKFQINEIARIFRVPPHMIGDLEHATFSNIEHQSIEFVTHSLMPWLVKIEEAINTTLLTPTEQETYFAEFLVDGLMRGDARTRMEVQRGYIQVGVYSPNEVRVMENRNPRTGGDVWVTPTAPQQAAGSDKKEQDTSKEEKSLEFIKPFVDLSINRLNLKEEKFLESFRSKQLSDAEAAERLKRFYEIHLDHIMDDLIPSLDKVSDGNTPAVASLVRSKLNDNLLSKPFKDFNGLQINTETVINLISESIKEQ